MGGTNATSGAYCDDTAYGPLCGVCKLGYFHSSSTSGCRPCSSAWETYPIIIFLLVMAVMLLPLVVYATVGCLRVADDMDMTTLQKKLDQSFRRGNQAIAASSRWLVRSKGSHSQVSHGVGVGYEGCIGYSPPRGGGEGGEEVIGWA